MWLASKEFCLELEVGCTYPSHPLEVLDRKSKLTYKLQGSACTRCQTELLLAVAAVSPEMLCTWSTWTMTKYTTVLTWPFSMLLQEEDWHAPQTHSTPGTPRRTGRETLQKIQQVLLGITMRCLGQDYRAERDLRQYTAVTGLLISKHLLAQTPGAKQFSPMLMPTARGLPTPVTANSTWY